MLKYVDILSHLIVIAWIIACIYYIYMQYFKQMSLRNKILTGTGLSALLFVSAINLFVTLF